MLNLFIVSAPLILVGALASKLIDNAAFVLSIQFVAMLIAAAAITIRRWMRRDGYGYPSAGATRK